MATLVDDVPQHMRLYDPSIPEKERQQIYPKNVENINFGLTTATEGLVKSRNVVAALVLRDFTGFNTGLTYLERVGLPGGGQRQGCDINGRIYEPDEPASNGSSVFGVHV